MLQPVQRNICIWTCFIIGAGGGNGVESTVLFPFMFGKAASHVVVFAGPPQVTHFLIVCHHGNVCHFLWFRQGVRLHGTSAKEHLQLDMFYYWCRRRQWG